MPSKNIKAGAPKFVPARALYPIAEAAVLLGGVGPSTLRRWIGRQHVRSVRVGGMVMVPQAEIDRLTSSRDAA